jgi:hypothetical protein
MAHKENGHSKNLANLKKLIIVVTSFGTKYAPRLDTIQIAALQALLATVKESMDNANEKEVAYHKAVSIRRAAYVAGRQTITRVICMLRATNCEDEVKEIASALVRKLRGSHLRKKAIVKSASVTATDKTLKKATATATTYNQRGFVDELQYINKLMILIRTIPQYNPIEEKVKINSVMAMYNDLLVKNNVVISATVAYNTAKIHRYNICYISETGMVDITYAVKNYVESVYGYTSLQYKECTKLSFKKIPL